MRLLIRNKWRVAVLLALLATLMATYLAPPLADSTGQAVHRAASPESTKSKPLVAGPGEVLRLRKRSPDEDSSPSGLFVDSTPKPPPIRVVGPPPAPSKVRPASAPAQAAPPIQIAQAPPIPFRVMGRYIEDGRISIFFQSQSKNIVARVGDIVEGQYKVVSINANQVDLLYMPLNINQSLNVGF